MENGVQGYIAASSDCHTVTDQGISQSESKEVPIFEFVILHPLGVMCNDYAILLKSKLETVLPAPSEFACAAYDHAVMVSHA